VQPSDGSLSPVRPYSLAHMDAEEPPYVLLQALFHGQRRRVITNANKAPFRVSSSDSPLSFRPHEHQGSVRQTWVESDGKTHTEEGETAQQKDGEQRILNLKKEPPTFAETETEDDQLIRDTTGARHPVSHAVRALLCKARGLFRMEHPSCHRGRGSHFVQMRGESHGSPQHGQWATRCACVIHGRCHTEAICRTYDAVIIAAWICTTLLIVFIAVCIYFAFVLRKPFPLFTMLFRRRQSRSRPPAPSLCDSCITHQRTLSISSWSSDKTAQSSSSESLRARTRGLLDDSDDPLLTTYRTDWTTPVPIDRADQKAKSKGERPPIPPRRTSKRHRHPSSRPRPPAHSSPSSEPRTTRRGRHSQQLRRSATTDDTQQRDRDRDSILSAFMSLPRPPPASDTQAGEGDERETDVALYDRIPRSWLFGGAGGWDWWPNGGGGGGGASRRREGRMERTGWSDSSESSDEGNSNFEFGDRLKW